MASPQKAGHGAVESSTSDLKDELIRRNMRIQELERSNKILKDSNIREQAKFVEAAKARKLAVDNEAALKKINEELRTQLAAAQSKSEQRNLAASVSRYRDISRGRTRNDILDDLTIAEAARKIEKKNNDAGQKRVKELEAQTVKLREDIQKQQRTFVHSQKQIQAQLAAAKAAEKVANDDNDAAQQKIKNLEAQITQLQLDSDKQAQTLKDSQSELHTAISKEVTTRKQFEELQAQTSATHAKDASTQTSISSLQDKIASLEERLAASQQDKKCQHCVAPSRRPGEVKSSEDTELSGSASSQAQPSEHDAVGAQTDPVDSAHPQQAAIAATAKTSMSTKDDHNKAETSELLSQPYTGQPADGEAPKSNSNAASTTIITPENDATDKPSTVSYVHVATQTSPPTGPDATPETPVSLLKAKLHYARSLQAAAENNAMLALDELLDLKALLRKHQKFEAEAKKEFAKANKMYSSLQEKFKRAMAQLQRLQEQKNDVVKIPAGHFAYDVDDDSKSATDTLLLELNEQLQPVKTQIRKSQAKKSMKAPEPPLKIAARRNRRLRDIIREREQEIANVRIDYGNRWSKVIASIVNRDSEIRSLKRKLGIRESRSNSDASVGATLMAEKDRQIEYYKGRAGYWLAEHSRKAKKIRQLNLHVKVMEVMKKNTEKMYSDLNHRFDLEDHLVGVMQKNSSI